jgi:hypothetical protein
MILVWVLIAVLWVGLLSLILHDATAADKGGSVVVVASKRLFKGTRSLADMVGSVSQNATASAKVSWNRAAAKVPSSSTTTVVSVPLSRNAPPTTTVSPAQRDLSTSPETPAETPPQISNKKRPNAVSKPKWWSKDRRPAITSAELEQTIAEAIRKTAPECEELVGVIVQHQRPKIQHDANWVVRGVKFGKADRKMVNEALTTVVEQLQQEFRLADS